MYEQKLTILGNPKALKRHRTFRRGKYLGTYDPSQVDKADLLAVVRDKAPDKLLTGPIHIIMFFYMPRPQGHYRTGKYTGIVKASAPERHIKRPDLDNLIKMIMDSLTGVFWRDDTQICVCIATKDYADKPRTEIEIKELEQ